MSEFVYQVLPVHIRSSHGWLYLIVFIILLAVVVNNIFLLHDHIPVIVIWNVCRSAKMISQW